MNRDLDERGWTARALLGQLYPPPHSLEPSLHRERVRFAAIPHARAPRLLADARSPRLASLATRRQSRSPRFSLRAARTALAAAARTGWYDRLPGTHVVVHGPLEAPSIEDPIRESLRCDNVRLAMSIGPRRANRKPVLQVADEHGRILAFVKVGHNDLTRALVQAEAGSLAMLSTRSWSQLRVPRVVGLIDWQELVLLVLEPLQIAWLRCHGQRARQRLVSVVTEIASVTGVTSTLWKEHPLHMRLEERLHRSSADARWLKELGRVSPDVRLRTGAWHGDLNPGNVALMPGPCPVWDWERFETGVPLGFDLLHHDLQEAITHRGVPPSEAATKLLRSAPSSLAPWGHEHAEADAVCRAYLIALADRYLADDQAGAGASLGRVGEWLLPVLEGWKS